MSLRSAMIYLDANATSRLRPEVKAAISDYMNSEGQLLGNPSSVHQAGRATKVLIRNARAEILSLLFSDTDFKEYDLSPQLIFTSGGTEACNSLIHAFLNHESRASDTKTHIISSSIEHQAILEPLKQVSSDGFSVDLINPNSKGFIDVDEFLKALKPTTELVCLMVANNVTGACQQISKLASMLRAEGYKGAIVSDATQCLGKSDISFSEMFRAGVNAVSISGHKIGAPSGIGAVVLANICNKKTGCLKFESFMKGGAQEHFYRAGTENVIGILGFGAAAKALRGQLPSSLQAQTILREEFLSRLKRGIHDICSLSPISNCLSNTLALRIPGLRGDDLVAALDLAGVCVSTGSACSSGKQEISHVFLAMGLEIDIAREAFRVSFDWDITEIQLNEACDTICSLVSEIREQRQEL